MMGIRRRTGAVGAANRLNPGASRRPGVPAVRRRTDARAACRPERSNVWVAPLTRPWWVASSVKVRI